MGYEGLRFLSARKEDSEAKGGCIFYFDKKEKVRIFVRVLSTLRLA
jgi:hypothetical protein